MHFCWGGGNWLVGGQRGGGLFIASSFEILNLNHVNVLLSKN